MSFFRSLDEVGHDFLAERVFLSVIFIGVVEGLCRTSHVGFYSEGEGRGGRKQ